MRIIKRLDKDKTSKFISEIIDAVIIEYGYNFFENLLFRSGKDAVEVDDKNAKIAIDKDNIFIKERDSRAARILILQKLELAFLKKRKRPPDYIEKLIVNRRLAKKFGKDLFYFYYVFLTREKKEIKDMDNFLELNLPWLSFYGVDKYNSSFLLKMLDSFENRKLFQQQTRNLFLALKKDMENENNLVKAIKELAMLK